MTQVKLSHLLGKAIQAHPITHRAPELGEGCRLGVLSRQGGQGKSRAAPSTRWCLLLRFIYPHARPPTSPTQLSALSTSLSLFLEGNVLVSHLSSLSTVRDKGSLVSESSRPTLHPGLGPPTHSSLRFPWSVGLTCRPHSDE